MPIPPIQKQLVEKLMQNYCDNKISKELNDTIQLFFKIRGNNITLIESRPLKWNDPKSKKIDMKIAQIRFETKTKTFILYCADRNEKWHLYDFIEPFIEPSIELEDILKEIGKDPTGIFWANSPQSHYLLQPIHSDTQPEIIRTGISKKSLSEKL